METIFWLRKTNQKFAYRQYLPPGFIHLPKHIGYSVTACRKAGRYVKIFSRISHGKIHTDFDFLAADSRPACEGRIDFECRAEDFADYSCVIPYYTNRRCQAAYMCCCPIKGWVSLAYNEDIQLDKNNSIGFFDFRKTYSGRRGKRELIYGLGKIDGKTAAFTIAGSVLPESYKYNDNILFFDGRKTPLPPVQITHPFGVMKKWIIQDTENMVDLVFNPVSMNYKKVNALIFKTEYHSIYGLFDGVLLTSNGQEIKLKDFPGIVRNYNMKI